MMTGEDPWALLRAATRARIGLGRAGDAIPLAPVLAFAAAHAAARDAVQMPLDVENLRAALAPAPVLEVRSLAADRATYLRRPDLGRALDPASLAALPAGEADAVFVIGDGLSAQAVQLYAAPFIAAMRARLAGWRLAPVVIATQARVALADTVGERLGARMAVMLIGERPGLSVAESMGAYLTYAPKQGRRDSERNCISNIHDQGGLGIAAAADKLAWLMRAADARGLSGVSLKDEAPAQITACDQALLGSETDPAGSRAMISPTGLR